MKTESTTLRLKHNNTVVQKVGTSRWFCFKKTDENCICWNSHVSGFGMQIGSELGHNIRENRPELQKKKILFHRKNASAHKGALAMEHFGDFKYELLKHLPSLYDLIPSDFYLFPKPIDIFDWKIFWIK